MKRIALVLLLATGCSWSNSLYHARRLSESALKAEREERSFDAGSFWGQVAVKADSAYSRNPNGGGSREALWLRGRALARLGECAAGLPLMERARIGAGDADWRDDLTLELARCQLSAGDAAGAFETVSPLLTSDDARLRAQGRSLAGRSLVRAERWQEAREFLADDETVEGTWLHALALARLGNTAEALTALEPRITAGDSLALWDEIFRALASVPGSTAAADLRERLARHAWATDTVMYRWDLATAQTMMSHDSAVATLMLDRITAGPRTPATLQARMLVADRLIERVRDDTTLAAALERIERLGRDDPTMMFQAQQLIGWGRAIRSDLDATAPGTPEGDLMLYFHATVARDTLGAPALAAWLLGRLERDWPTSPYVPKALLARMLLQPDSLEVLRSRFETHTGSPYLAFVRGQEDSRFAELEYALDFYLSDRFANTTRRGEQ